MNVYTYFLHINDAALPVIALWKESWSAHGWNPVVLGPDDFKKFPKANDYHSAISKLPTINTPDYEHSCYHRWAAMAAIGGGLLVDYDVYNFGFKPSDLPEIQDSILILDRNAPCVVFGSATAFEAACSVFASYQPVDCDTISGRPHTSDMHICNKLCGGETFRRKVICEEYRDTGWDAAPLVHFATFKCRGRKQDEIRRAKQFHTSFQVKKKLSIVIPEFKRFDAFATVSIKNREFWKRDGLEVILVKDHAGDDRRYIDFCKENFGGIDFTIIRNPNDHEWRNPSVVLNVGIRAALGEFVFVHSPESAYVGDVPAQFLAVATHNEAICGKYYPAQPDEFHTYRSTQEIMTVLESKKRRSAFSGSICASRLDLFTIAGYDERFKMWGFDDMDIRARLEKLGCAVRHFDSIRLIHLGHDNPACINFPEWVNHHLSFPPAAAWTDGLGWGLEFSEIIYKSSI